MLFSTNNTERFYIRTISTNYIEQIFIKHGV